MPKVHHVAKARKAYKEEGIGKGDEYWWWQFRSSPKVRSKTPPRASQLTRSEYLGTMYALSEGFTDVASGKPGQLRKVAESLEIMAREVEQLRDEQQDRFDNMAGVFLGGCPTMDLLEERMAECEELVGELETASESLCKVAEAVEEGIHLDVDPRGAAHRFVVRDANDRPEVAVDHPCSHMDAVSSS